MSDDLEYFEDSSILPRRMNEPTVIFMGCTLTEMTSISVISSVFWIVTSLTIGFLVGMAMTFLAASILLIIGTVFMLAKYVGQSKAGKPTGYFAQMAKIKAERKGMAKSHLFLQNGELQIGRSKQYISTDRLLREDPYHDLRDDVIKENTL